LLPDFPRTILKEMERRQVTGLEFCLVCGHDFVSMVGCTSAGSGSWRLLLRCGGCGTWHETFAGVEAVAALHRATCEELDRMASEAQAFSRALELDLIGPDDFHRATGSTSP
jgi:hypothetical protein